MSLTILWHFIL